jgi:hypothetical protein
MCIATDTLARYSITIQKIIAVAVKKYIAYGMRKLFVTVLPQSMKPIGISESTAYRPNAIQKKCYLQK